jgi:NADH dehydrogenase [ubiquinone] 1 alpha subcomplex assembly factor 2
MLKLPWRKKWLVGFDLSGNTFWEFKNAITEGRPRRILHYDPKAHVADVKIPPSWLQWLRYTRFDPPTIEEQQLDEVRQVQIKQLAAAADARWAAKGSYLDSPAKQQAITGAQLRDPGDHLGQTEPESKEGVRNLAGSHEEVEHARSGEAVDQGRFKGRSKETPRMPVKLGKSDIEKQPEPWTPTTVKRR